MKNILFLISGFIILFLSNCQTEDYKLYDVSQTNRIYFEYDSLSFIYGARADKECDIRIPIKLIGMVNIDKDVEFDLDIDAYESTGKQNFHYTIEENQYFKKDSVLAYINIDFDRSKLIKDVEYSLYIYLKGNEHYIPANNKCCTIEFGDITISQPTWWKTDRLGEYTEEKYILFIECFKKTQIITPVIYDAITYLWGEFLDKTDHWRHKWLLTTYTYTSYFKQYFYVPMYEYYLETGDERYEIPNPNA